MVALPSGQSASVDSAIKGFMGSATFRCTNGVLVPQSGANCYNNFPPNASLEATANGMLVEATAAGSNDPDGKIVRYAWDFGDGTGIDALAVGPTASHVYTNTGDFTVTIVVTDNLGATARASAPVAPRPPVAKATGLLNDTGIGPAQCYQSGNASFATMVDCASSGAVLVSTAQDGSTGRDAVAATSLGADGKLGFSFTKLGSAGQVLQPTATDWNCVRDEVTGVMWEVKTGDGGLRDAGKSYTNFSGSSDPLKLFGAPSDATGYAAAVNAAGLCGARDWRLPTVQELQSLVDYGAGFRQITIDLAWFPRIAADKYWTSTQYRSDPAFTSQAWFVQFAEGMPSWVERTSAARVLLVRGEPFTGSPRWIVSADGQEVTDNVARLIWRRCSEGMAWTGSTCSGKVATYSHEQAFAQASEQARASLKAWRVPNAKELFTLSDTSSNSSPTVDPNLFPGTVSWYYWAATPYLNAPTLAWTVNFGSGGIAPLMRSETLSQGLRLVRTAP